MKYDFLKSGTLLSKDKDHLIIGWGERKWSSGPTSQPIPHFYFPDFFLKIGMPWFTHDNWMEISIKEFKTWFIKKQNLQHQWQIPEKSSQFFNAKFLELQSKFRSTTLLKAVPYLFDESNSPMTQETLASTLAHMIDYVEKYPAFAYGLWDEREGFLGATPEILFTHEGTHAALKTVACAGTLSSENYEINETLMIEHQIVVDGIMSSLQSIGKASKHPLQKIKFKTLSHLVTEIEVKLREPFDFKKIVAALHPTPALGAFPKDAGMHFLEQYQMNIPRGRFGAPVGFFSQDFAQCVVAIRNVQWNKTNMRIGAGCGLVEGSVLQAEQNEIRLKLEAIKELLGL